MDLPKTRIRDVIRYLIKECLKDSRRDIESATDMLVAKLENGGKLPPLEASAFERGELLNTTMAKKALFAGSYESKSHGLPKVPEVKSTESGDSTKRAWEGDVEVIAVAEREQRIERRHLCSTGRALAAFSALVEDSTL